MHGSPIASNSGRAAPVSADAAGHHSGSWRPGSAGVRLSRQWLARPGSDLVLLVEFPTSPSFEQYMDLKLALEDLLSVPVDLVTRRGLRAELRQRIEDEAIPLA